MRAEKIKLEYIDGVRALAALYVVLCHTFQVQTPGYIPPWYLPIQFGEEAVDIFILLSGFCLALPQASRNDWTTDFRTFFKRRAWRIIPPYLAAVALGIVLSLLRQADHFPATYRAILLHLLMVQNWFGLEMYTIVGPLWSVAVECQIYLLFPLMVLVRRRMGLASMLVTGAVLGQGSFHVLHARGVTYLFTFFVFGMACAEWAFGKSRVPQFLMVLGVILVAAFHGRGGHFIETGVVVATGGLLAYVAGRPGNILRVAFSWTPLVRVGTFSYSIYLIHGALIEHTKITLNSWGMGHVPWFRLAVALTALVSLPISYAFHVFLEQPFMNSPARALDRREAVELVQRNESAKRASVLAPGEVAA